MYDEKGDVMKNKSRMKLALISVLISLSVSVVIGIVFSIFISRGNFLGTVLKVSTYIYFLFCCGGTVSAILLLITKLPDDLTFGYGNAIYYGTVLLTYFLIEKGDCKSVIAFLVSLVIVCLVCYIVWEKKFKWKYIK